MHSLTPYLTGNGPRLFESDSTILKWRMSAWSCQNILWNASCIDGFGVLTDAGTNSSIWHESISSANESQIGQLD